MRDVTVTYWKLIEKFKKCPTGKVRHFVYPPYADHESDDSVRVSYAHRVCLCYLIWLGEQNLEACELLLKTAASWRKQEERYATPRTAIEKLARIIRRRFLPKLRKQRAQSLGGIKAIQRQMSEGIGIHDPEYPVEKRRETGRMGAEVSNSNPNHATRKKWWVIDPEGNTFMIENLSAYCKQMGLVYSSMKHRARTEIKFKPGQYNCRYVR